MSELGHLEARVGRLEDKIDRLLELAGDQRVLSQQISGLSAQLSHMGGRLDSVEKKMGVMWLVIVGTGTVGGGAGALLQHLAGGG